MSMKSALADVAEIATENVLRYIHPDASDLEFADAIADHIALLVSLPDLSHCDAAH